MEINNSFTELLASIGARALFPTPPTVPFRPAKEECSCGHRLESYKTQKRKVFTMEIGPFFARETILKCPNCNKIHKSDELSRLVPESSNIGFNVIEHIGRELWVNGKGELEVWERLKTFYNIDISCSELSYLGKKFIAYLAIVHEESQDLIKEQLLKQGGYILHLDGTCEGESPVIMTGIDGISNIVLANVKLPSENAKDITLFLSGIEKVQGQPISVVSDLSASISAAVKKVFPNIKHFICHFHFLRDLGKDFLGGEYDVLRKGTRSHKVQGALRALARKAKIEIENDSELQISLAEYIANQEQVESITTLPDVVLTYILIQWVLSAKDVGSGYGFPFDRPYMEFFERLVSLHSTLTKHETYCQRHPYLKSLYGILCKIIKDEAIITALNTLSEKVEVFERLRSILQIAKPENGLALNDDGDTVDMISMENELTVFKNDVIIQKKAKINTSYEKMLKQIDQYWEKLFATPMQVTTADGIKTIYPQRTNNTAERLHRFTKRILRGKSGTESLNRIFKSLYADFPFIKNLGNDDYMKIILNGRDTLADRFADVRPEAVRKYIATQKELAASSLPRRIKKILRTRDILKALVKIPSLHTNTVSNGILQS